MSDMVNVNFKLDAETKRGTIFIGSIYCVCQESQPRETYPV